MTRDLDEVMDRRLDQALREATGSEQPPDVRGAVLARAAGGDKPTPDASTTPTAGRRPWFAAAALLIGAAAVVAALVGDRDRDADVAVTQDPGRRALVRTLAELAELPADVERVELRGLGDAAAAKLAERGRVTALRFVWTSGDAALTDRGLAALAGLDGLRQLEVHGCDQISGAGLAQLAALPLLELVAVDCELDDDAVAALARWPALAELELIGCRSFGARGLAALARSDSLRSLSLRRCAQLDADAVGALGALTGLRHLDLRDAGGLTDRGLMGLQFLTGLRTLRLGGGRFSTKAMQALDGMQQLDAVDLSDNAELVDSALLHVPVTVTELTLDRCPGMSAGAGALLRDRFPGLRTLSLVQNAWVDDAALGAVLELPRLAELRVTGCQSPTTAAARRALRSARALRMLEASQCGWFTSELQQELAAARPELHVTRRVW